MAPDNNDGPSETLISFIESNDGKAPEDWKGYREAIFWMTLNFLIIFTLDTLWLNLLQILINCIIALYLIYKKDEESKNMKKYQLGKLTSIFWPYAIISSQSIYLKSSWPTENSIKTSLAYVAYLILSLK